VVADNPNLPIPPPPGSVQAKVEAKLAEAERKAWVSLAGYKFIMFGYWAGQWVLCKSLLPGHFPNPFYELARLAKQECKRRGWLAGDDNG
jgi:hypothetical protein